MKWSKSKLLCLFLALLLFSSSVFLSAEVCLTDEEFRELETTFETLDDLLLTQGRELRMLKANLSTAQTALIGSQVEIAEVRRLSVEAAKSWQEQKLVTIIVAVLGSVMVGVVAFATGMITG